MLLLQPNQLTILATSQCTARCGHCSMNSGPERRDSLTFEQIRQTIDSLHNLSQLRVVIFAGGEPTLIGEDLLDSIAHADSLGINTRIVTNASWAITQEKAKAKLIEMREAGLQELNVSADDYHLPYIPFERVENAWHASKGLGFRAVVIANCSGSNSVVTPRFIMDRLGEEPTLRFDDEGCPQPLGSPAPDGTTYILSNANLQMLGRAHDTVSVNDLIYPTAQEDLEGGCPWAVRSPALSPKNHLVACCGIEAEHNEVLDFGHTTTTSAANLVQIADNQVIVNAIALMGPMFLKRFIQEHKPDVSFQDNYGAICEVCEHIVNRSETVAVLEQHIDELAVCVLAIRSQLGEVY